ncbi:hypothetical protein ABT093_22525 [Kitasatospora sp. NPDC002551]|uniref:hypothetical protein n=1 Tax=Kitasatospora sp. NPDC002551 TaxID=3154539 RepID=UPI0033293432
METGEIDAYLRARDERAWQRAYRAQGWGVHALGLLALAVWLWAVGLAFLPLSHTYPNGYSVHCGSPVFFDFTSSGEDIDTCAGFAKNRMRDAFGIGLVTLPLSVGWLWRSVGMRVQRVAGRL